jgi:transposase-like protein
LKTIDRDSSFEPKLVRKREKDISNLEDIILLLYQKGLTTRDIQSYLMEIYNYDVSPETISNITDRVIDKAREWQNRSLELDRPRPNVILKFCP